MVEEDVKNRVKHVRDLEKVYIKKSNYSKSDGDTKAAFYDWIDAAVQLLSDFYPSDNGFLLSIKELNCSDGFVMNDFYNKNRNVYSSMIIEIEGGRGRVVIRPESQEQRPIDRSVVNAKPPKVFISHKWEDRKYADALVRLINFILGAAGFGAGGEKVFCSSVPGYGIGQAQDILVELRNQFDNYNVFMVIIHSPRYYQSAVCLNEMGASWVLGTKFASFMTKDCEYDDLKGVINDNRICINPKDERRILNWHLNNFKDDLISFFNLNGMIISIDESQWENERDHFIEEVS